MIDIFYINFNPLKAIPSLLKMGWGKNLFPNLVIAMGFEVVM